MKPCAHCGTEFQPKRPERRFCSRTCCGRWRATQQRPFASSTEVIGQWKPQVVLPTSEYMCWTKEEIMALRMATT